MLRSRVLYSVLALAISMAACGSDSDGDENDPPADANSSAAADASGDSPLPFMSTCDPQDDQCDAEQGHICFSFNNGGPHCTHSCDGDGDCEDPSPGCNGMGVCKRPGG